jgi:type I pantothenate kinase
MIGAGGGFESFTRQEWSALARPPRGWPRTPDLAAEAAEGEPVTAEEILEVYIPLCQLLELLMASSRTAARAVDTFLTNDDRRSPFVIGIAGGVAVGKSTTARVLRTLLSRGPGRPTVELLGTDAFLFPNRVLEERGLSARKGFPDTYDRSALLETLAAIRSGAGEVAVPVYSHQAYDVLPDDRQMISRPDIVVVEGLNVLQTGPSDTEAQSVVSDYLDAAIYIDSSDEDAAAWFLERLLGLRTATGDEGGPFLQWFSSLSEDEARTVADLTWSEINLVNVRRHVAPTRGRAHLVLRKDAAHRVCEVRVRRP